MSVLFRILLFAVSSVTLFLVLKKIRNAQTQIESAVFWILFTLGLVVVSVFPGIAIYAADLLGVESAANLVFLCIIFLLLIKVFDLSLHLSKLQYQIQRLTQIIALSELQKDKENVDE